MYMVKRFGANLKKVRLRLHLTQAEVGFRVGRDASYIGKVERGKRSPPVDFIYILARALEVSIDELVA